MNLDLFVDTSRKGISMALSQSGTSVYEETVAPSARGETASAILDELLTRVGADLDDIKRVLVTVGPGSFSGLRTGVAFCQGLCFSGKRKLHGVSTLQALQCFGATDSTSVENVAVIIRARPGYWYLRQTRKGKAEEYFIETKEAVNILKSACDTLLKSIVADEAACADEMLAPLFKELNLTVVTDVGKPLSQWAVLFNSEVPSLIQEANYIQPSYFEKLK
ncbi:MAG: tRNA (adenosine(37)-N6)-threonylcarbamoyltransferase complex dimerization subunit type 1 TsaB [Fibrobacter sp.]|nr:tRNA (adenosine(37)-N6)-threonylcarbamoyltransferase complex dimerization subunit type 1 TsaB [Fibrobacter sp.]